MLHEQIRSISQLDTQEGQNEHSQQYEPLLIDRERECELTIIAKKLSMDIETVARSIRAKFLSSGIDQNEETKEILKRFRIFIEGMKLVWPNYSDSYPKLSFKLASLRSSLTNITLKFEPLLSNEGRFERQPNKDGGEIVLGIKSLLITTTETEFDQELEIIKEMIFHEVEHIDHFAKDIDDFGDGAERVIGYLAEEGEIRAHAKQFAYKYQRRFPNEPFNLEKMRRISTNSKELNYFNSFADPAKQEKYRALGDLANIHRKIVDLTAKLLTLLNEA